jgi:hypothetical protein
LLQVEFAAVRLVQRYFGRVTLRDRPHPSPEELTRSGSVIADRAPVTFASLAGF